MPIAGWSRLWRGILCVAGLLSGSGLRAGEFALNGHRFKVPDGLEVELVAAAPLVERPITCDFDERGRLYVADSSGSNDPVQKQLEERPHRIVQLRDTDGDGRFDTSHVFADRMMFPEGTLWFDGSLYVAAPPVIWKLTDTNDDGVCDQREVWFDGKTLTGCANDLHGPYLGPDGWIYWCKGAFAEQTYEQPGTEPLKTRAAHIFRRRPDGTGPIENVMTGGMDNPVDVVFTPGGERLFTTTFLQNPGGGLRDGIIHAVYGGVYGKVHNVTDFHPRTGDLLPPLIHLGAAAPCGLHRYESTALGPQFRDNVLACQFNMHKVSRHELKPAGATFQSADSDLIVSDNLDFHPTDVLEDAGGSVIVCDTGGWYKLCCPTSQLAKPDVLGALYRIRRKDHPRAADPRGLEIPWATAPAEALTPLLGDSRVAVQKRAIQELARRPEAVAALARFLNPTATSDAVARSQAVWTLTRINSAAARECVRKCLTDPQERVRLVALQSVSLWRDAQAAAAVQEMLNDGTPHEQRLAAEILGRLGNASSVPHLLNAPALTRPTTDRMLEHSIVYALIELADPRQTAAGLTSPHPGVVRASLVALDQMRGGGVVAGQVVPLLTSSEPRLKETALWLTGRHPEWGDAVAGYLRDQLAEPLDLAAEQELVGLLTRFAFATGIQGLLAERATLRNSEADRRNQRICLAAMQQSGLKQMPEAWARSLGPCLKARESDPETMRRAIAVVRSIPPVPASGAPIAAALREITRSPQLDDVLRVEAAAAQPPGTELEPEVMSLLLANLGEEASVSTRSAVVEALVRARLAQAQLMELAGSVARIGPLELSRVLGVFETVADEAIGLKLVASLKDSPVLPSLRVDTLRQKLARFPQHVHQAAEELYAVINVEAGRQKERLDRVLAELQPGDVRRGQLVFQESRAACSACHAIGYLGGTIGPDLSRIGKIRTERDLLESLLFPSVSFVRSYEPLLIITTSGKSYSGLVRRETPEDLTLATGAREEVRIPRSEIEEIRPGTVSIMPAGLDTQLTPQQLADLIAFLKSRQ